MNRKQRDQISRWIETGEHVILDAYRHASPDVDQDVGKVYDGGASGSAPDKTVAVSIYASSQDQLVGEEGDVLLPSPVDIHRVYADGRETWASLLRDAKALPPRLWPPGVTCPTILLKDVPALPSRLPKSGSLAGQPRWRVPDPDGSADKEALGVMKQIWLGRESAIECRILPQSIPGTAPHCRPTSAEGSLAVLVMCWSYILSARFLHLQRRKMQYIGHYLQPQTAGERRVQGEAAIDLRGAVSDKLVTWISALLAPQPGWRPSDGGHFPPGAAFCGGYADYVIVADSTIKLDFTETPPSFVKATELLIEFCRIFGLGTEPARTASQPLAPYTAAFYAALALRFGHFQGLRPQFPTLSLRRVNDHSYSFESIGQYFDDLTYYMTLSIDPPAVGSVFWSIFWQPEVECNLVSPWLTSILDAVKAVIDDGMSDVLPKALALRRPRVAPWWVGVFLLGDTAILGQVTRYLETLEERYGFSSMATPDPVMAAWTGVPQSFLDMKKQPIRVP